MHGKSATQRDLGQFADGENVTLQTRVPWKRPCPIFMSYRQDSSFWGCLGWVIHSSTFEPYPPTLHNPPSPTDFTRLDLCYKSGRGSPLQTLGDLASLSPGVQHIRLALNQQKPVVATLIRRPLRRFDTAAHSIENWSARKGTSKKPSHFLFIAVKSPSAVSHVHGQSGKQTTWLIYRLTLASGVIPKKKMSDVCTKQKV